MHLCLCDISMQCLRSVMDPLDLEVLSDSCELPCGSWESNLGPLEEQLLTTASLLQPQPCDLLHNKVVYKSQVCYSRAGIKVIVGLEYMWEAGKTETGTSEWWPTEQVGGMRIRETVEEAHYTVLTFLLTTLSDVHEDSRLLLSVLCRKARSVTSAPTSCFLLVVSVTL